MASKKYQILCQKCAEIKNKKAVKFRAKDNGKEKTKDHEPQTDVIKQRKRSKTTWRKISVAKESPVRSPSKSEVDKMRSKRLSGDSPYESAGEADDCGFTILSPLGEITPKNGILKRRSSSADAIPCYRNTNSYVSPFLVNACQIGEDPEPASNETYRVPSLEMFEEKRPKKIRFKIPEGTLGYEDAKKAMWRSGKDGTVKKDMGRFVGIKGVRTKYPTEVRCNSLGSPSESIREIMPVLERLKKDDDLIESELDLNKIARYIREENEKERERGKFARERKMEREEPDESRRGTIDEEDSEVESEMDLYNEGVQFTSKPNRPN